MKFPIKIFFNLLLLSSSFLLASGAAVFEYVTQKESDGIYGNVKPINSTTDIPTISWESENTNINNISMNTRETNLSTVWVSSSSTATNKTGRTTKVLEKPIESQLISQFHELNNSNRGFSRNLQNKHGTLFHENLSPQEQRTSTVTLPPQTQPAINSFETRKRLLRRKYTSPPLPTLTQLPIKNKDNIKREDSVPPSSPVDAIPEGPPGSEIEFTYPVSPIEGSLGGLTGLQGLPPLTFVQFIKLLEAVSPFIIPIIFIPLLIFTIGVLMIPVTRANVFVDVGDLRAPSSSMALLPSFIAHPIRTIGEAGNMMALPRSMAYDVGTKLLDTEQCVERISCEISARYLHSHWEQGNWRSVLNTSWISRILKYLWQKNQTFSRIAKSLPGDENWMVRVINEEKDQYVREREGILQRRNYTAQEQCGRYICQPRSLLRKFVSPVSPSLLLPSTVVSSEQDSKKLKKVTTSNIKRESENEQTNINL